MSQSQETTYYTDGNVTITNSRAMISGKTYSMANVTSVGMTKKSPSPLWPIFLGFIGLAFTLTGIILVFSDGSVGTLLVGLAMAGLAVAWLKSLKTQYRVTIGSASGETNALVSKDQSYINGIVKAMNEAIVNRG